MEYDRDKVDEMLPALLWLTLAGDHRAWKSHDWDALDRLHAKGYISDPRSKAKSVVLSYSGSASLTCALATSPSGAQYLPTCSVTSGSPISITNGTPSGTATVTIDTTAASTSSLERRGLPSLVSASGGTILALLVFLGIPARRRSWRNLLGLVIMMAVLSALWACGGGSSGGGGGGGNPGTTAGDYTFTVTGDGSPGFTPAPNVTVKLTVN